MVSLTPKQRELLAFIDGYQASKGYCPSFAEMAAAVGVAGVSGISRLVAGLEERGAIRRPHSRVRGIEVIRRPEAVSRAPDGAPLYFVSLDGLGMRGGAG